MKFAEILPMLLTGSTIYRTSKPEDHFTPDAAEGGKYGVWRYDAENDDLIPNHGFQIDDLAASDWEVQQ